MKKHEFDKINELEMNHWWYVGTREICFEILEKEINLKKKLNIMDVGCGTGGNMLALQKYGKVSGIDLNKYAINYCRQKGLNCEVMKMEDLEQTKHRYDLVTFFDVFNQLNISKQTPVLNAANKILNTGGLVALREPALEIARGRHDLDVNIKQRFNTQIFSDLLTKSNFKILHIGYLNSLLFPLILTKRKIDYFFYKTPRSDVQKHTPFVNSLFLKILRLEKNLFKHAKPPFGLSIFVIARKVS